MQGFTEKDKLEPHLKRHASPQEIANSLAQNIKRNVILQGNLLLPESKYDKKSIKSFGNYRETIFILLYELEDDAVHRTSTYPIQVQSTFPILGRIHLV